MRRRALSVVAALFAAVLAACTRAPAAHVLKLMVWGAPDEVGTVKHYVDLFRERTPGIDVVIQHAPDMGYREKLNARFLGGDPPDVFYLSYEDFPGVQARGWLATLDDLMDRDRKAGTFDADAYFPGVFDKFRAGGKTYGVVKDFATLIVYYNKDQFDKYGVPYPKPGWTWDDFLSAARRLTHSTPGAPREYGVVIETWPGQWFPWVWSAGGRIVEEEPPRWVMGEEPWLDKNARAFQFLSDLIWKEGVAPNPSVTRDQGTSDLFKTGKAAMCTYGRWMCMQFRHIHDFEWDTCEMPRAERKATTLFPVCYAMARETRHRDQAWELLKFLTSEEVQVAVAESGHAIPSMKRVARSDHFFKAEALRGTGVNSEPNVTSVEFAEPGPRLLTWHECRERLNRGLEALWNGTRRDAREVLLEMQPVLSEIVRNEESARNQAKALQKKP